MISVYSFAPYRAPAHTTDLTFYTPGRWSRFRVSWLGGWLVGPPRGLSHCRVRHSSNPSIRVSWSVRWSGVRWSTSVIPWSLAGPPVHTTDVTFYTREPMIVNVSQARSSEKLEIQRTRNQRFYLRIRPQIVHYVYFCSVPRHS